MFCAKCGSHLGESARFCAVCGTAKQPRIQTPPTPAGGEPSPRRPNARRKIPKSERIGMIAIISSGLAVILLFHLVIGPYLSKGAFAGVRTAGGTASGPAVSKVISTHSVSVSPDNPVAKAGDVSVDFKDNLYEEGRLTVERSLRTMGNERYAGLDVYDFTMEGQSEFPTLIDITLPNTAAQDEGFHVGYFNEETAKWEKLPYEILADGVRFSTTHFSQYALIRYYKNRYDGPLTPVEINSSLSDALKAGGMTAVDELESFLEISEQTGSDESINFQLSLLNNLISLRSAEVTFETFDGLSSTAQAALSKNLTAIGGMLTLLKVAYQLRAGDPYEKVVEDNIFNLAQLSLLLPTMIPKLGLASSQVLPMTAFVVFLSGCAYEYVLVPYYTDDSVKYASEVYHAFCNGPNLGYDPAAAEALAKGESDASPWVVLSTYNTESNKWEITHKGEDFARLQTRYKWECALNDIYEQYRGDSAAMQQRIDALLDEYTDMFWQMSATDQLQFAHDVSPVTREEWRWPTVTEEQQMKAAERAGLMIELRPVFEKMIERTIWDMQRDLLKQAEDLAEYLNQQICFVLVDPEAKSEGIENTRAAKDIIRIEPVLNPEHQEDWVCDPQRYTGNEVFRCTLFHYMAEGCPAETCLYKTRADMNAGKPYKTLGFRMEMPVTQIMLGQEYVWALTLIKPAKRLTSLDGGAMSVYNIYDVELEVSVGDGELNIQCVKESIFGMQSARARIEYPAMILPNVEGGLTSTVSMISNTFTDSKGEFAAFAYSEFHDTSGYKNAAATDPGSQDTLKTTLPKPGEVGESAYQIGVAEYELEVGIAIVDGMGVPPRYGITCTYTWMPYEQALQTKPQIFSSH